MPISFSTSSRTPAMNSRSCSTHRPHVSAATLQPSLLQTRCWKELAAGRLISAGLQRRKGGKLVHCYMNKTRVLNVRRQQCQCNLPQLLIQTARKSQARPVLAISHSATTLAASIATLVNILALCGRSLCNSRSGWHRSGGSFHQSFHQPAGRQSFTVMVHRTQPRRHH